MAFEIRKISNVGTGHPVVARLGVQMTELIDWVDVDNGGRNSIVDLYVNILRPRLLRCYEIRDGLVQRMADSAEGLSKQNDPRVRVVPHVVDLQGIVEGFLYETKNYLRDLLKVFQIVYGCDLKDASAFADLNGSGDSDIVTWANSLLGPEDDLSKLLKTEQDWVGEFIRMRNAIEHPGGLSGTLTLQNIRVHPNHAEGYIPPTWERTGRPASDIIKDMDCGLDNMLTLAEDLLGHIVMHKSKFKGITLYEIPVEQRDPKCPIRLRVGLSPELGAKIGKSATSPET